jgi:aerobic carbon-monoxide dehydrogenase large subunit
MTMTENRTGAVIGSRMLRREDPPLLTGESKFTADLAIPGALHMALARSPYAHANILSVDCTAARNMPGVYGAWSGACRRCGPGPCHAHGRSRPT